MNAERTPSLKGLGHKVAPRGRKRHPGRCVIRRSGPDSVAEARGAGLQGMFKVLPLMIDVCRNINHEEKVWLPISGTGVGDTRGPPLRTQPKSVLQDTKGQAL